ncbi:MAG TPA: Pycsar system effector family protein [Nitrospiraceae bacterium]|nr:Pycsar system effector family protein [Nitrospiraceae bacterium]
MGILEQVEVPNIPEEKGDGHAAIYALRTVHQCQTQLVVLADQKANILIGVIAVTHTIIFTKVDFLPNAHPMVLGLFVCALLIEAVGVCFALLTLLPRGSDRLHTVKIEDVPNLAFFGFFANYPADQYVEYLCRKLGHDESARKFLAMDIYQVGVVLKKKYKSLRLAYVFGMAGAVMVISLTVIFLFTR